MAEEKPINELAGYSLSDTQFIKINTLADLLNAQEQIISFDLLRIDKNEYNQSIPDQWTKTKENIFIHHSAVVEPCYLDSSHGSICIGPNVRILAGTKVIGLPI